ncbi:hypothetical protein AN476_02845 [Phaeobacter sp. 11ANDIMAR09]|nr:hypothetical protein AN476_02845 [Phaeobacter sp. 11ANDIMAR09]
MIGYGASSEGKVKPVSGRKFDLSLHRFLLSQEAMIPEVWLEYVIIRRIWMGRIELRKIEPKARLA